MTEPAPGESVRPADPPLDPESRRWAIRAIDAPFEELAAMRASAEQWRNGLAGLTALLSAASLIASPTLADRVPARWHVPVGALALAGLLALLYGTWRAMNAAFGVPGGQILTTGEALREWEHSQATAASKSLATARRAFLAGILAIVAAAATAYASVPAGNATLIRVTTHAGAFCGQLTTSAGSTISVTGPDGTLHVIPISGIRTIRTATLC